MDLDLLHHHARRNGKWTMQLTKQDVLECRFSTATGQPTYVYFINGKRVTALAANAAMEKAFVHRMREIPDRRAA